MEAAQFDRKVIVYMALQQRHVLLVVRTLDVLAKGRHVMGIKIQKWQQKQDRGKNCISAEVWIISTKEF